MVGRNVVNLHFCPAPKPFLSQYNDLLSRLVVNGRVFCPGTESRKNGTERRNNVTDCRIFFTMDLCHLSIK